MVNGKQEDGNDPHIGNQIPLKAFQDIFPLSLGFDSTKIGAVPARYNLPRAWERTDSDVNAILTL